MIYIENEVHHLSKLFVRVRWWQYRALSENSINHSDFTTITKLRNFVDLVDMFSRYNGLWFVQADVIMRCVGSWWNASLISSCLGHLETDHTSLSRSIVNDTVVFQWLVSMFIYANEICRYFISIHSMWIELPSCTVSTNYIES